MDLKYLHYILAIYEEKSISKAAKRLYISQPTLSVYLAKLEDELGTALFTRDKGHVYPTDVGLLYIDTAKKMIQLKSELYSKIGVLLSAADSVMSVGIYQNIGKYMINAIYPEFAKRYPEVRVDVIDSRFQTLAAMINENSLDFGIVALYQKRDPNLEYQVIKREEFVLAVSNKHKNIQDFHDDMSLDECRNEVFALAPDSTVIREVENYVLAQHNMIPHVYSVVHNLEILLNIVEEDLAISMVPKGYSYSNRELKYFTLKEQPYWNLVVVTKKGRTYNKPAKDFMKLAIEYYLTHDSYFVS